MKELIGQLMSKANLTEEQAQQAAVTVRGFLQEKVPGPLWGAVESALTGEAVQDAADKAKGFIGGFLGGKD